MKHCNILIVDDNRDAADTLHILLECEKQFRCHTVYTPEDALSADFMPDVALLDLGLPRMNGWTLAEELRKKYPKCKIIAVTGHGQPRDKERSKANGIKYHLVKPVDLDDLNRIVHGECDAGTKDPCPIHP